MKKIVYSLDAIENIQEIDRRIRREFGSSIAQKVKKEITNRIRSLAKMEGQGVSMFDLYGITPDFRRLYVAHNYVFYLIEDDAIQIVNVYNEKEDFMYKLFGISSVDDEAENYWDDIERDNTP